jgi:hypothetical protein
MSYLGNTPDKEIVLRLEARKSFALGIYVTDVNGRPLDLSNSALRLVVKKTMPLGTGTTDFDNLIANSIAEVVDGPAGFSRFNLQASDLNYAPAEYPFAVILVDAGYSAVILQGIIDLIPNTEFASVGETYAGVNPASSLQVALRGMQSVSVRTGPTLAPGTTSFTDADKAKLDSIEDGAEVNVTPDWRAEAGQPGFIRNRPAFADGEPLDGVASVNGQYGHVSLVADDIPDGVNSVTMTTAERAKLLGLTKNYADLDGKPVLGTAAAHAAEDFLAPGSIAGTDITSGEVAADYLPQLSGLRGFGYGSGAPTDSTDGALYLQLID